MDENEIIKRLIITVFDLEEKLGAQAEIQRHLEESRAHWESMYNEAVEVNADQAHDLDALQAELKTLQPYKDEADLKALREKLSSGPNPASNVTINFEGGDI